MERSMRCEAVCPFFRGGLTAENHVIIMADGDRSSTLKELVIEDDGRRTVLWVSEDAYNSVIYHEDYTLLEKIMSAYRIQQNNYPKEDSSDLSSFAPPLTSGQTSVPSSLASSSGPSSVVLASQPSSLAHNAGPSSLASSSGHLSLVPSSGTSSLAHPSGPSSSGRSTLIPSSGPSSLQSVQSSSVQISGPSPPGALSSVSYAGISSSVPTSVPPLGQSSSESPSGPISTRNDENINVYVQQAHWSKADTLKLIDNYEELIDKASSGKLTKNRMWTIICSNVEPYSAEQCRGRWKTITDAYRRTKDRKKKSGNGAVTKYEYEDELDRVLGVNAANISPVTLSSSSLEGPIPEKDNTSTGTGSNIIECSTPPSAKKRRTYTSSAQEVLEYLRMSDEREAERQKKESEAREKMHAEKMGLLRSMLDILAKRN